MDRGELFVSGTLVSKQVDILIYWNTQDNPNDSSKNKAKQNKTDKLITLIFKISMYRIKFCQLSHLTKN